MTQQENPLDTLPLLLHLSHQQRSEVMATGKELSIAAGEILFHEEDPAKAMYVVLEGQIKLVRYSPGGKEMLIHLVGPVQSFAEAALFGRGTYPATAVAVRPSRLWILPRSSLLDLIRRSPELGISMVASTSLWTRKLVTKLELLTQRRIEERLAIHLIGRSGTAEIAPGQRIRLTEPKHLVAAQCGTAPEVLSRTFRRLEDSGIIRVDGEIIEIVDPEKLQAVAEWIDE